MLRTLFLVGAALLVSAGSLDAQRQDSLRLSIEDAVQRAVRESDEARVAAAQVEVSDAQVMTARAAGLPQMRLASSYSQVLRNARAEIVGQSIFGQNYNYSGNINISQVLFQGGRVFAGSRAAGDVRAAARLSRAETQAVIAVDVQRAYLNTQLSRELLAIQQRNVELAAERLALVERLEAAGRASRFDVLRARVERTNLEPQLLQAKNAAELAEIEVRRVLNVPASQPLVLISQLDSAGLDGPRSMAVADSGNDPVRASERAALSTLNARREGVRVARADLMPTITTFFQTGYTALPSSNGFPTVWGRTSLAFCAPTAPGQPAPTRACQNNGWFADRNFGVQVAWPLFDGLRTKGNIDLAQAQTRLAQLQLDQERERVSVDRARTWAEFRRAEAAFEAQRQNVGQAEEAFKIAALRFERGLSTQLEVSDAQLLLLTARTNAARATTEFYLATADLARARGLEIPLPPTHSTSR
ncbi:MAG: TolC family protein [Gemmatimonadaceae bacterium]|nr:TolC family protein [Gemmatimonadaceae bacterium]